MGLCVRGADDVLDRNFAHPKRVGDKRTMASPRDRFSAHQRAPFRFCELDGAVERGFKFGRLHVVRESTESRIAPAQVDGILDGMSQATELLDVRVSDSFHAQ